MGRDSPAAGLAPGVGERHNAAGGTVLLPETVVAATAVARRGGLAVHLDGARLFNAAVASGRPAAELAAGADTVMFCFSKGLGAPVGSVLCGSAALIDTARSVRRRFGGTMRQAGVLAAAARVALRGWERLGEDHSLAAALAAAVEERLPGAVSAAADQHGPGGVTAPARWARGLSGSPGRRRGAGGLHPPRGAALRHSRRRGRGRRGAVAAVAGALGR